MSCILVSCLKNSPIFIIWTYFLATCICEGEHCEGQAAQRCITKADAPFDPKNPRYKTTRCYAARLKNNKMSAGCAYDPNYVRNIFLFCFTFLKFFSVMRTKGFLWTVKYAIIRLEIATWKFVSLFWQFYDYGCFLVSMKATKLKPLCKFLYGQKNIFAVFWL